MKCAVAEGQELAGEARPPAAVREGLEMGIGAGPREPDDQRSLRFGVHGVDMPGDVAEGRIARDEVVELRGGGRVLGDGGAGEQRRNGRQDYSRSLHPVAPQYSGVKLGLVCERMFIYFRRVA
jgi:hypothetical protein